MKKETERLAQALGFECYYDLQTGTMRSRGGDLKDWLFTLVLISNFAFRKLMWKLFFVMISLDIRMIPDENETMMEMYEKMSDLIERGKK